MAGNNALTMAMNMIAAPAEALRALKLEPTALLPLFVILISNAAVVLTYYSQVDVPWLIETGMQSSRQDLTEEEREAAANAIENLSPLAMGSIAAVSVTVFITLWIFLNALYLAGVSLLTRDGYRLKHWFAMICWCALPIVFGHAASAVNILSGDSTFLRADRMNPLSFSSLLDLENSGSTLRQSVQSLDITAIWAMALGVFGYHTWTQRSVLESALIVLAPAMLIFFSMLYFASG